MTTNALLRLAIVKVDGLFGLYNHHIVLNLEDRVTLLHGPNGVGKTVVLCMTDALLRDQLDYFKTIPFSRFLLGFHDGSELSLDVEDNPRGRDPNYRLSLLCNGRLESLIVNRNVRADYIASQIDYLRPFELQPHTWQDIRDGELLTSSEVLSRYGRQFRDSDASGEHDWTWYNEFLERTNTHFIEAHRLVRTDSKSRSRHDYGWGGRTSTVGSAVVECGDHFQHRLGDTMARYGRDSQALDQSFPQRLMSATDELSVHDIQAELRKLDTKTAEYKSMGILDETRVHPFDTGSLEQIDKTQTRVMTLYLSDTATKLKALEDLARRAGLLLSNVNEKYRHKRIRLDRERGLVAESENGKRLPLSSLSSGEQHELVLLYDLLFRVPSNTIVLIDEPELSLHIAWQKRLLPDLLEIAALSDFDALVATHSPFVIADRDDLMVGLGDSQ